MGLEQEAVKDHHPSEKGNNKVGTTIAPIHCVETVFRVQSGEAGQTETSSLAEFKRKRSELREAKTGRLSRAE